MPTIWNPDSGSFVHYTPNFIHSNPDLLAPMLSHPNNSNLIGVWSINYPEVVSLMNSDGEAAQVKMAKKARAVKENKPGKILEGFTLGADPELFVVDTNGVLVCADMIPGTKDEPYKVEFGAVQRDGFAAEYNIDPCSTFEEWNRNHKAVQGQLQDMLPKGFKLVATPAVRFSPEVFDAAPDMAKELGCQPDWNAWEAALNPPPRLPDDPRLRCTGGHIHAGWLPKGEEGYDVHDTQHMMNCFDLTKQFDWFLGTWSLKHDKDVERRRLYGKAGSCRIKPYGVEYRVLSSFWVLEKELRLEVWNRACLAITCMSKYFLPEQISPGFSDILRSSINNGHLDSSITSNIKFPISTLTPPFSMAA
jgi:hypothetical protein